MDLLSVGADMLKMSDTKLAEAKKFLISNVIEPALNHRSLEVGTRTSVVTSREFILNSFTIGDLYKYLELVIYGKNKNSVNALNVLGLNSFESVYEEFQEMFPSDTSSTPEVFQESQMYNSFQISIGAQSFGIQPGVLLFKESEIIRGVVIKGSLNGGRYSNRWVHHGKELIYSLYQNNPEHIYNRSILEGRNTPVHVLLREGDDQLFKYYGVFYFSSLINEGESYWFVLSKQDIYPEVSSGGILFEEEIRSQSLKNETDANLTEKAQRQEDFQYTKIVSIQRKRNLAVKELVLRRAAGICEDCKDEAPFLKRDTQDPYLEIHHIVPLAMSGPDTVENCVALCPNCHRKRHYG